MNNSHDFRLPGLVILVLIFIGLIISSSMGQAGSIPNMEKNVQLTAREQPIEDFLQDMFGQIGLPVLVHASVTGVVNANFNAPAHKVLRDISRAFGLVTYYDGAVVHAFAASDVMRRVLALAPQVAERVVRSADEMWLTDARNTVRSTQDGSLVVTGTPRFIEQVEELVQVARKAQTAQHPLGFKVFYLRYAWAQDVTVTFSGRQLVVPGVASILRSLFTSSPQSHAQMIAQDRLLRSTRPGLRGKGLAGTGDDLSRLGIPDAEDRYAQSGVAPADYANGDATAQQVPKANASMLSSGSRDQVRIEADPRLNAIIVRDAPERMMHYEQLIASLDVEPQSLEIEATIIDINTDRLRELGINWRWNNADNAALFGRGDASDLRLRGNTDVTPSGRGGFISMVLGDNATFIARINALEAEGAARIVSRPQVLTLSNVEAIFDTSSTFYVRVAGSYEADLFDVSVGTSLRVTPHVFKDDGRVRIKLLVTVEDGNLSTQMVDEIPIVERSTINTQALINAGESLLIGGMVRETTSEVENKVPFLGDIPLLGMLFRSRTDRTQRIERMFLISPRLAPSQYASPAEGLSVKQAQDSATGDRNEEQSLGRSESNAQPLGLSESNAQPAPVYEESVWGWDEPWN
ncbi:MAG: type III secretion system outer membrane ring subunit SctC [Gammaproteobacteria bacterium]|nr:type III secretion system outer membrane ring subunit SctC [Gammaproteobacteria bacterium]